MEISDSKKIFIIIPAFNEEGKIGSVIKDARKYADEIVVIDDGSSDRSSEQAERAGAKVISHRINRGQGAALETGNRYALANGADIIVHFDADGQFLSGEIPEIIAPILDGSADIVFGSRFLSKRSEMPLLKRWLIMPFARAVNLFFFGITTTDPQSGFRAFSQKAARMIIIENDRMAHCSEILAKASASDLRIKEVPITVLYPDFGQRFSGGLDIIKDLLIGKMIK
jgi:polyprenyl-phospho-N-acetylgalactosaminyl synthase